MNKHETMDRLRAILSELYDARYQGGNAARFYKAQGMADGYMQALSDLRIMPDGELLRFVNHEKRSAAARADSRLRAAGSIRPAVELV